MTFHILVEPQLNLKLVIFSPLSLTHALLFTKKIWIPAAYHQSHNIAALSTNLLYLLDHFLFYFKNAIPTLAHFLCAFSDNHLKTNPWSKQPRLNLKPHYSSSIPLTSQLFAIYQNSFIPLPHDTLQTSVALKFIFLALIYYHLILPISSHFFACLHPRPPIPTHTFLIISPATLSRRPILIH